MKHAYLGRMLATVLVASPILAPGCDKAQLLPIDAGQQLGSGAQVPRPPERTTEGADDLPWIFVLRDVRLRQAGSGLWRTLGWNLDDRCSYPPQRVADAGAPLDGGDVDGGPYAGWDIECAPANVGDLPAGDGEDCRDNNYGQFVSLGLEALPFDAELEANTEMERGRGAILVRLFGYNGTDNDPLVTIEVVPAATGIPEGGVEGERLRWDGTDTFYPDESAYDEVGRPLLYDRTGYVVDGLLVMRIPPRSDFRFAGNAIALSVRVTDGTLTGRIVGDRLEGVVLSARWSIDDLLNELDDLGVCEGSALRRPVETAIRGSADLLANPEAVPGALVPCDAISAAIGLTGYPGRWGKPARRGRSRPHPCTLPDAGVDGGADAGPDGGL